jgi:hypothetical protein
MAIRDKYLDGPRILRKAVETIRLLVSMKTLAYPVRNRSP